MDSRTEDVMDIDRALERAMEADDPGPAFAGRVIAAITGDAAARPGTASTWTGRTVVWRALLPLAATVALTVAGVRWQPGSRPRGPAPPTTSWCRRCASPARR
jgi:hypothetical protein